MVGEISTSWRLPGKTMDIQLRFDCENVDWGVVSETLKTVGMAYYEPCVQEMAFKNSHTVVFAFHEERMIGFGRAISDGTYQAAIYDIAVRPEYQGRGIGRIIMESILERIPACNVILYSFPGREGFYEGFGFRKMRTGMALFKKSEEMSRRGFTD